MVDATSWHHNCWILQQSSCTYIHNQKGSTMHQQNRTELHQLRRASVAAPPGEVQQGKMMLNKRLNWHTKKWSQQCCKKKCCLDPEGSKAMPTRSEDRLQALTSATLPFDEAGAAASKPSRAALTAALSGPTDPSSRGALVLTTLEEE